MNSSVSVQEKKLFLEWLLYQFESREIEWLLEEMIQDERKLNIIRFVESTKDCPKGIQMTIGESSGLQFLFFKGNLKTRDVYTAFHELQLHGDEDYFIQLDFPEKGTNFLYQTVKEVDEISRSEMKQTAETLLEQLTRKKQLELVERKVNQALDEHNEVLFHHYAIQWKNLITM